MKIGFFCKHKVGCEVLKTIYGIDRNIFFAVVDKKFRNDSWYNEISNFCKIHDIHLIEVDHIKNYVQEINNFNVDVIFSVYFTQIIPVEIIHIPVIGIINFHPSLLPKYRGPHPVNWAIINGEKKTGITVHFMNEVIDGGPIILKNELVIGESDTGYDVGQKLMEIIPESAKETYFRLIKNQVNPVKQDEEKSTYFSRRTEKDDQIEWCKSTEEINNFIRALSPPLPGAYSFLDGKKITLGKISYGPHYETGPKITPGNILDITKDAVLVESRNGYVSVVQFLYKNEIIKTHSYDGFGIRKGNQFVYRDNHQ